MRNVEFRESSGATPRRRIIAGGVVLFCALLSLVYLHYAPRLYEVSMKLILRDREKTQGMLATAISKLPEKMVSHRIATELESGELLKISCFDTLMPGERTDCGLLLEKIIDNMKEQCQAQAEKERMEAENERKARVSQIDAEIKMLPGKYVLSSELKKIIGNLKTVATGKGEMAADWMAGFSEAKEVRLILATLEDNLKVRTELLRQITRDRALYDSLLAWTSSPANQTITTKVKRVVHYEDSPELIKIKDRKAEVEAARMRLLQRATSKHPLVRKMSEEINELQAQINALTRLPKVVEDVRVITNPELVKWNKELADIRSALSASKAKLMLVHKNISAIAGQLQKALENQLKRDHLHEKNKLEASRKETESNEKAAGVMPFELYYIDKEPAVISEPEIIPTMLYGTGIGIVAAFFILLTRKRTDFTVTEEEEKPEFPVLGSIPRFVGGAGNSNKESA